MARNYYKNRNTRAGGRTGFNSKSSKDPLQAALASKDSMKDIEKSIDVAINFQNKGAAGTENTLTVNESKLQTGLLVNYTHPTATTLHNLICEPVSFAYTGGQPVGVSSWVGLRGFVKSISVDVTLATINAGPALTNADPIDVEMIICKVKGSNLMAFGGPETTKLFTLDSGHSGKTNIYKLAYKRVTLQSGSNNSIKIKYFKNINSVYKREDKSVTYGQEPKDFERLMVVWRFYDHDQATANYLTINGVVKLRTFDI